MDAHHTEKKKDPIAALLVLAVDLKTAAAMVSVSRRTLENYIAAKRLPARKIGRRTLIRVRDLERRSCARINPHLSKARAAMRTTNRREVALKRGADDLMNLAEYSLRETPALLAQVRQAYTEFCLLCYRALERTMRGRQ